MEGADLEDVSESHEIKRLRREVRELAEEVEELRKRKANTMDVEALSAKISAVETEVRTKYQTLHSDNQATHEALRRVVDSLDSLKSELTNFARAKAELANDVEQLKQKKGASWERVPTWLWVLAALGAFAVLQLGPEAWSKLKAVVP